MRETKQWLTDSRRQGEPLIVGGDLNAAWFAGDRYRGALTHADGEFKRWACELWIKPADLWHPVTEREHSYVSQATSGGRMTEGGGTSRVDDFLLTVEGVGFSERVSCAPTSVMKDLTHTSDHHPVLLLLNTRDVPWEKHSPPRTASNTVTIRRIRRGVSKEEVQNVRELLMCELHGRAEELLQRAKESAKRVEPGGKRNDITSLSEGSMIFYRLRGN